MRDHIQVHRTCLQLFRTNYVTIPYPPGMTNDTHRDLWCFIKGDPNAFEVTAPVNASIARLKKLVWEERQNGAL